MLLSARAAGCGGLLLALLAGGAAPIGAADPPDAFGRWEQRLRQCRISLELPVATGESRAPTGPYGCEALRLDQQLEGLLVIRWLSPGGEGRRLSFAGLLDQGSRPMSCNAEGRCRPAGPMAVWLNVIAESGLDPRSGRGGLPRTRLVQGLCRLEARQFRCEATESDGTRWLSEGRR